jgi:hypothetical protein
MVPGPAVAVWSPTVSSYVPLDDEEDFQSIR